MATGQSVLSARGIGGHNRHSLLGVAVELLLERVQQRRDQLQQAASAHVAATLLRMALSVTRSILNSKRGALLSRMTEAFCHVPVATGRHVPVTCDGAQSTTRGVQGACGLAPQTQVGCHYLSHGIVEINRRERTWALSVVQFSGLTTVGNNAQTITQELQARLLLPRQLHQRRAQLFQVAAFHRQDVRQLLRRMSTALGREVRKSAEDSRSRACTVGKSVL